MKLTVERFAFKETYTIGRLLVEGKYFCDTLEDKVRPAGEKIFGKTAIPSGTYQLSITYSPKFKKNLPLVMNVPGFEGIRIHPGNTPEDTEGCLLVGWNKEKGKVLESKATFSALMDILLSSKDKFHTIEYIDKK